MRPSSRKRQQILYEDHRVCIRARIDQPDQQVVTRL